MATFETTTRSPGERGERVERVDRPEYRYAEPRHPEARRTARAEKVMLGGSVFEALTGAGAIVLPILGLVGIFPGFMAAITAIVIGAGLVVEGGAFSSQYRALKHEMRDRDAGEVAGGMSVQFLGGAAAIALGILALVGILPLTLLAIATIVLGVSLLFGASATAKLDELREDVRDERQAKALRASTSGAAAALVLVGLASAVLGILVLADAVGGERLTLILVAMLSIGGGLLVAGSATGAKLGALARS